MGKKSTARKSSSSKSAAVRRAASSPTDARKDISAVNGYGWNNAFDAAKRSGYRGLWWFPNDLDAQDKMPERTRTEILRNNAWLYDNLAPVRMLIDGLSLDEVDTGTWPKATTDNLAFNKAVTDDFHELNKDPRFFSASGMESYYSAQWLVRRSVRLHGELFGQFLRPGQGIAVPTMHFINPWQCANLAAEGPDSPFRDGIRSTPLHRALEYRFTTDKERTKKIDVPAEDILHFHDQVWAGQTRALGILTPCTRNLYRFDDIERAETSSLLARAKMAYTITRTSGADDGPMILPGAKKVETLDNGDGTQTVIQHITRDAGGDMDVDVANIPAGFDMKVLESNRANVTIDTLKWILNCAAYTTLYPTEYVFGLAGMGQGTLVRLVQKRVQRVKNTVRQFQLIPQFCDRWYTFWLWQRIKGGFYDNIEGGIPANWWKHKTICPADDTVDLGREGRLYDERLETGKMSPETYHGQGGEDASDVEDEILAADLRRAFKIKAQIEANPELAPYLNTAPFAASTRPVIVAPPEPDPAPAPTPAK